MDTLTRDDYTEDDIADLEGGELDRIVAAWVGGDDTMSAVFEAMSYPGLRARLYSRRNGFGVRTSYQEPGRPRSTGVVQVSGETPRLAIARAAALLWLRGVELEGGSE